MHLDRGGNTPIDSCLGSIGVIELKPEASFLQLVASLALRLPLSKPLGCLDRVAE
jgi:hypothetical protein